LYIHEHRVLKELDLYFDPLYMPVAETEHKYHLDFLVGVNGTGKSTVLRLLGRIFSGVRVSFDELRDLRFILEYYLDSTGQKIRIANIYPNEEDVIEPLERYFVCTAPGLHALYEVKAPDEEHLKDAVELGLLPRVIAYTTGNESIWLTHNDPDPFQNSSANAITDLSAEDRAIQELPGWIPISKEQSAGAEINFRFVWQEQLPLVALAGLLLHSTLTDSPLAKVLQEANIARMSGFALQFDLAYSSHDERNAVWQRFGQYASRAIRTGAKISLVFQPDQFETVLKENSGALAVFEQLADWQRQEPQLLTKVNLLMERPQKEDGEAKPPLHTWDWLSDGERSFIGRMCLFMLFGEDESLILLDEPEVHFNDYWKRHIVSMMHQVFEGKEKSDKSHVLIATHSSISLSDVPSADVLILKRPGLLTSSTKPPDIQTFGADPSDIMVHVFDAPHAMGEYSVDEIENWLEDAYEISEKERRRFLQEKLKQVSPGYWAYRIRREMVGLPVQ
jgi:ABC-type cobalamin/Fe3+-siderophores transport system ATPase subunit